MAVGNTNRRRGLGVLFLGLIAMVLGACSGGAGASSGPGPLAELSEGQLRALGQGLGSVSALQGGSEGFKVRGTGVVSIEPELAVLSMGVEETAGTVAEARSAAAESMDAMIAALRDAGISDDDMQTQRFQIRPEYHRSSSTGESRLSGFRVTNTLIVKVWDLDSVGDVIDRAAEAGGDATRINHIQFTVEEGGEAEDQARRLAVQDAVAKADLYAEELGLDRGRLLSLNETSGSQFPRTEMLAFAAVAADMAARTPIQAGEFEVMVTVEAVFAIQ